MQERPVHALKKGDTAYFLLHQTHVGPPHTTVFSIRSVAQTQEELDELLISVKQISGELRIVKAEVIL